MGNKEMREALLPVMSASKCPACDGTGRLWSLTRDGVTEQLREREVLDRLRIVLG